MRRLITGAVLLAATSLPSAAATPAETLVRDWLDAMSFGLPVDVGASRFDPSTRIVALENVTIGKPGGTFSAVLGTLEVTDPRRTPEGIFAAHRMRGSDLRWTLKVDLAALFPGLAAAEARQKARAAAPEEGDESDGGPDVETDIPPPFDMSATVDAMLCERPELPFARPVFAPDDSVVARYLTLARWMMPARADWVELNGAMVKTTGVPQGDQTSHYGLIYMAGLHDGRIERTGVNDYRQTATMEGEEQTTTVGSLYAVGIDGLAALAAIDPPGGVADGKWRTIIEQTGYNDVTVTTPEAAVTIGNVELDGLRLRSTGKPLAAAVEQMLADPEAIEKDPDAFARDVMPTLTGLYGVDFIQMADFQVKSPDGLTVGVGQMDMNRADRDGIGALTFREISVEGAPGGSGSLDLITFNKIRFGSLAPFFALSASETNGGEPSPKAVRDVLVEGMPALDYFELSGLAVETPDGTIGLDAMTQTASDYVGQLAMRSDSTFTRLSVPASVIPDPQARETLQKLGYDQVVISGGLSAHWHETGEATIEDLTLEGEDIGVITAAVRIGNLPRSLLDDPARIEQAFREATLDRASLTFGNQSIVERVFEMQAKELNQKPEDFRRNFAAGLPLMLGFIGDKAVQDRLAAPLKAFFEDPKSLTFTIRPAATLPLSALESLDGAQPGEVFKLLGLEAKANE